MITFTRKAADELKDRLAKEDIPKSDVDLIVMARHGNTKNKTTLMGEFTEFVVKNIPLPVLLI